MRQSEIDNFFTYHPPTSDQVTTYEKLRSSARNFANAINELVPECADKTAAIRLLREATWTANAAVACHNPGIPES